MARLSRLSIANQLHLLVQKTSGAQPVLVEAFDCQAYLECLWDAAASQGVAVHAYSLMPAEVRVLATPSTEPALGLMLQALGRRFVVAYNRRHHRSGALWAGRFRSTVVEAEAHFVECLRYVEMAPVQAACVERAEDWAWSSAGHHVGKRCQNGLTEHPLYWQIGNTPFEREATHRQLLQRPLDASHLGKFDHAAERGWALGSAEFVKALGSLANRRLLPLPRGRRSTSGRAGK